VIRATINGMQLDRHGLEVLGPAECMAHLALGSVGRVGFTTGALPAVLPVDYWLEDDRIHFRTSPGSDLDAAVHDAVVAFEVDDGSVRVQWTWSVLVTGRATAFLGVLPVSAEHLPGTSRVVTVVPELISGRRLPT
jgi:hypothetical protein